MTKMYSAVDKVDGTDSIFILNKSGVLVYRRDPQNVEHQIEAAQILEQITPPYLYSDIERFNDAIGLTLVAEWEVPNA